MEKKFQSLSLDDFYKRFTCDEDCYQNLIELKWGSGYSCPKCKNIKYCKGVKRYDRQCTKCSYIESPTAGTIFHHVKFPLLSAFKIVYFVSTNKKGIASTELSRKLKLRQKTCWLFKLKAMQAMESNNIHPLEGDVEIIQFEESKEKNRGGAATISKRKVILAIEKKTKGAARIYGINITGDPEKCFKDFCKNKIAEDARIHTSSNYYLIKNNPRITKVENLKRGRFTLGKRIMYTFKNWMKAIHCHVNLLQYYINEYCYRHNRHGMKGEIFDDLLKRMVKHKPAPYHSIIA